jgi:Na+/H+ antiporter NhaD and related arsenite permeases
MLICIKQKNMDTIPLWTSIPFVLMLLLVSVGPYVIPKFWENNINKLLISLAVGLPVCVWLFAYHYQHKLIEQLLNEYLSFIIMLGSLFSVTGGIHIKANFQGNPTSNTLILGLGALFASIMGTTGASMLLVRILLDINKNRKYKTHTFLFFIAIVANAGGILTPLGDPPLFLLYLNGVRFSWFLELWKEWFFVVSILLAIYHAVDTYYSKKEVYYNSGMKVKSKIKIEGAHNFIILAAIVATIAFVNPYYIPAIKTHPMLQSMRGGLLLLLAVISIISTRRKTRYEDNQFSWNPILEVAAIFLGIFITMTPTLIWLDGNASHLGINTIGEFYFSIGGLSSFLDNAPTALAFYNVAIGLVESGNLQTAGCALQAGVPVMYMKAICLGSVMFGSMTYIGNGPNFMVKAIAEENKINMPGFFGYIYKFSLIVMLPMLILLKLLFL